MIVHLVPQSHDTGYGKRKEKRNVDDTHWVLSG